MLQFGGRIPATEEREEEQYRSRRPAFPKDLENGYGGQNKDERRAFIKGAKRINRQDLKVLKFANGLKDVQTFIDAVSWKHGITRAEFQRMSAEEGNELDEFLVLYLFNKLEGEPARWWTTLTAGPCCSGRSAMCSKWGLFKVTRGMAIVHSDRNDDSKYLSTTEELHDSSWRAPTTIVRHHTSAITPLEWRRGCYGR